MIITIVEVTPYIYITTHIIVASLKLSTINKITIIAIKNNNLVEKSYTHKKSKLVSFH